MENNKNNVLLTIIGVATLLVALVGASFAYFSATGGTATQDVSTGTLKISAVAGAVNGANIKPVTFAEDATVATKIASSDVVKLPVTVTTTGTTIDSEYNMYLTTTGIALNTAAGEGGSLADLKWELVKGADGAEALVAKGDFTNGNVTKSQIGSAVEIPENGTVDEYKLLIYIANTEDATPGDGTGVQDQLQGLNITAFVTVEAKQK